MTKSAEARRQRKAEVVRRASGAGPVDQLRCIFPGCRNPTRAASARGLNQRYCRQHEDHFQRHGSYYRRSYSASELKPYRVFAERWLVANGSDPYVQSAIKGADVLIRRGRSEEAFRLRGLTPAERASVAWGRLRKARIPAVRPVAAWLAVEMRLRDDPQAELKAEFRRVQAAKLIHRMASGTHKRWEQERSDGRVTVVELHKYPASRGRVLRHIGEALERVAELVVQHHLDALLIAFRQPRGRSPGPRAVP